MLRIIQKRNWLFTLSLLLLVPGLVALFLWGLKVGLDFTGGTRMSIKFSGQRPAPTAVTDQVTSLGLTSVSVQTAGDQEMLIKLPTISNDQRQQIIDQLNTTYPGVTETAFDSVGPTIGQELFRRAVTAMILVFLAIVFYISWAFRKVSRGPVPAWAYGLSAIVAVVHDLFILIGIFSILGHYFGIEVDALFVTALLTVLGFSVHDTIVVFDRVRERLLLGRDETYEETVNVSLNQTLVRSLGTSFTTMLVLTTLYLFGGHSIHNFALALLIGIASGTYSSIFVAAPLLVVYERWRAGRR